MLVRFGLFDFNPETRELRREGVLVKLQAQPAEVLSLLIDARGEVVSREDLRNAVWKNGTVVDFDRGLNFCIAQIRTALGDSSDSPRFIRTVPKRGYQFIAPVSEPVRVSSRRRWLLIGGGVCAGAAVLVGGVWMRAKEQRIAVVRFDNETGNPELDRFADGVTDSVVAELTSSTLGRYGVIGNAPILRRPREAWNLPEIASSLGARFVILGEVQPNGDAVRVLAHLIRMPEQTHLWVSRFNADVHDPPAAAQRIASDFTRRLSSSSAPTR